MESVFETGVGYGQDIKVLLRFDPFLGAGDRILLFIEKFLDAQDEQNILFLIDPLAGLVLLRVQALELGLPIAQDMRLYAGQLADLADPKEEFVRYLLHELSL